MAFLGCEGFDYLPAASSLTTATCGLSAARTFTPSGGVWSTSGNAATSSKLSATLGGSRIQLASGGGLALNYPSTYTAMVVGFRWNFASSQSILIDIFFFTDGTATQCGISVNTSGKLIFWRGTNATILATGATTIATSSEHYIELKVLIGTGTSGTYELRLDGSTTPEFSSAGANTQNTGNAFIKGLGWTWGNTFASSIDDLYANDTTGGAPYNDFLGNFHVETLFMNANSSVAWTPLSSTNVSNIDEVDADGDTTYNFATASAIDEFTHPALAINPTTIFVAEVLATFRKLDLTAETYRTKLLSGGTTNNGSAVSPTGAYVTASTAYLNDPATSSAWSMAGINATVVGYERI
jgi:hypothetical protein